MSFRDELALLWADIMRTPVKAFFAGNEDLILDDPLRYGQTASPGYVGRDYRPGGWLLVGNFPAGGTPHYESEPDSGDKDLYGALQTLQMASSSEEISQASASLWDTWIRVQTNHRIYQTVVHPLLSACGRKRIMTSHSSTDFRFAFGAMRAFGPPWRMLHGDWPWNVR
jgi:hypothetical protein